MVSEETRHALLKQIVSLEESFPLGSLNALGAGGTADYFTVAHDTIELAAAVKAAMDHQVPYLVIGLAESVLFSDGGFPGLVIQNQATQFVIANDHSQMVVDSGMPLQRFITSAAGQGFGGLTSLYGEGGTVGGALYANVTAQGQSILSSVRHLTLLLPPTKMKIEPTIVRYRGDWLEKSPGETKLQWLRASQPTQHQPVILNAVFQLTSVRSDELVRRITREAALYEATHPKKPALGPLFGPVPGADVNELLLGAGVSSLRIEGVFPDRYLPNFLHSREKRARSASIAELMREMQELVRNRYAVDLIPRLELLGAW